MPRLLIPASSTIECIVHIVGILICIIGFITFEVNFNTIPRQYQEPLLIAIVLVVPLYIVLALCRICAEREVDVPGAPVIVDELMVGHSSAGLSIV